MAPKTIWPNVCPGVCVFSRRKTEGLYRERERDDPSPLFSNSMLETSEMKKRRMEGGEVGWRGGVEGGKNRETRENRERAFRVE